MPPPSKTFGAGGTAFLDVTVRETVCESVRPANVLNAMSQKPVEEISPNFVSFFGFVDVLVRFWGQRSNFKGQGHCNQ